MTSKIIKYNQVQSLKYGWDPTWFHHDKFDPELIKKIMTFQADFGLTVDGYAGPSTYRRLWTERESSGDYNEELTIKDGEKHIVCNGKAIPIKWDKVKLWNEPGALTANKGTYKNMAGKRNRKPKFFLNHWDVCLSSASCQRVLNKRKLSVHFLLDNDGTIHQVLDTQHIGFHAGRSANPKCIGIEISSAYSLKYQRWYKKNGFGPRPILENAEVHGQTLKPFLGFYDHQLEALAALWAAISDGCDIPLEIPSGPAKVIPEISRGGWTGFCNHYNISRGKIDCAGMPMSKILQMAIKIKNE